MVIIKDEMVIFNIIKHYVENNHEAIIDPQIFELVQAEIAKRNKGKERYSGVSIFSTKVQCAECGGWYGSKVWHSNDKYRRIISQLIYIVNKERCICYARYTCG